MRHNKKKGLKLGTDASHTKAMKKSLAKALFENDRIKTTETRAKALRSVVEPIITWAKKGDLHSRRLAIAKLGDKNLVAEIFDKAAQGMWADRNGGYTRIMKLGTRKGDNAEMVIIELVTEPVVKKAPKKAAAPPSEREAVADESAFSSDCAVFHWLRITPPNTSAEAAHCPAVNRSSRKTIPMNNVNTGTRLRKAPVREAGTERTAKLYSKKESIVTPTPR